MIKCLPRYDPEKGSLKTHLWWGARAELTEYIRQAAFPVATKSRSARTILPRVQKAVSAAEGRGLRPSEARLAAAEELGATIQEIEDAIGCLTAPSGSETLETLSAETAESGIEEGDRWTALMQALGTLDEQDQELILMKNIDDKPWAVIARERGVSEYFVKKAHDAAMKRIRAGMKNLRFDDLF